MKKLQLGRRTLLRGMLAGSAVAVGLPLMEAMLNGNGDAMADGAGLDTNFMTWFWGNGAYLPTFEPTTVGADWQLSESLAPLAPVKDYVNLVTGLQNRCRNIITHHEGMCIFSGYDVQPFSGPKPFTSHMGGPTIDQVIADIVGGDTPTRSIQIGVDRKLSTNDGGTTLAALSHRGINQPEYPEHNPVTVWTLLFGNYSPKDNTALRTSLVSAVRSDVKRLQGKLGSVDRQILESHLDGLDALEKKIATTPPVCEPPMTPSETNPDIANQHITSTCNVMDELIAVAFKCGVTRVASNLFHYGASHLHYHMIGQQGWEHHNNNSHANGAGWQQRYTEVVTFCMERLSHLAQLLRNEQEVNGDNLLDSTIIYASSDCSNGWSHTIARQPVVLIGHGRNALKYPGIHYQGHPPENNDTGNPTASGNTSDVLLTVLQGFDAKATQIGDLSGDNAPGSSTPLEAIRGSA